MPLPRKELLVLPNPWTSGSAIHPEKGPQGCCMVDPAGRDDGPTRFVGAARSAVVTEKRPAGDPRGDRVSVSFSYPSLSAGLTEGKPERVPRTSYYLQQLEQGGLVPGDTATADLTPCRFKSLREAKDAAIAEFDAIHGKGSWLELEALLAGPTIPTASAPAERAPKVTKGPES